MKQKDSTIKRVLFTGILGLILYYRAMKQLSVGKWVFWSVVGTLTRRFSVDILLQLY